MDTSINRDAITSLDWTVLQNQFMSGLIFQYDPNNLCPPSLSQKQFTMLPVFIIQMSFSHNFCLVNDFGVHTETRAPQISEGLRTSLQRLLLFNKTFLLPTAFWDVANDYFTFQHFSWANCMIYEDRQLLEASALHLGSYLCQQNLQRQIEALGVIWSYLPLTAEHLS